MGYLAYILAALSMLLRDTRTMTFNQGVDAFLDTARSINGLFFTIMLVLLAGVVFALILSVAFRSGSGTIVSGVISYLIVLFAVGQGIVLFLNTLMAESWGPDGATDPTKFLIALIVTILIGLS